MEIHQIRYFLAVARELNFSRAAESCHVTQPALTRAIQRLEEEVRGPVFDRRPGHVALTELGRTLLPRLQAAMAAIGEARQLARSLIDTRRQRLRLGLLCTLGLDRLMPLLTGMVTECPGIALDLTEATAADVVGQVTRDEIDVAIAALPRYPATVDTAPLYAERYVVAMAGDHPLVARSAVRVADLAGVGYVERTACEFEAHYVDGYGAWPVEIDVRCRSAREDCVQALIATGLGVAIVPASLPLRPDLVTRPLVEPEVVRRVCLVTPRDRTPTAPVTVMRRLVAASGEVWATAID